MRSRSHKCPGCCQLRPLAFASRFSRLSMLSFFAHTGLASQYTLFALVYAFLVLKSQSCSHSIPGWNLLPSSKTFALVLFLYFPSYFPWRHVFLVGGGVGAWSSLLSESDSNVTALVVLRLFFGEVVAMAWTNAVSCAMS